MSESIEEWARERGPQLDEDGWRWTWSDRYSDDWIEAVCPYPSGSSVTDLKAALRAFARSVWDGLSDPMRSAMSNDDGYPGTYWALERLGLLNEGLRPTPLGRACIRAGADQKSGPGASTHGPSEPGGGSHARPAKTP